MKLLLKIFLLVSVSAMGQSDTATDRTVSGQVQKKWYDNINLRGYVQVRYNRLLETNDQLTCEQCDRSWGENGGLFLRRARIIFSGQIHERIFFYIQPDFASSSSSNSLVLINKMNFVSGLDKVKFLMVLKTCNPARTD